MKASELRLKDISELNNELNSLLKAQFKLRMQMATKQLVNTAQINNTRKGIARIRTILTEKARKQSNG
ncbi:large subunit ribosomal protein L29 [Candidatus Kinetoplastibacterium desouzaii TCC079E]|uniref:Large ribosomal subunit protein uL29 n=1 Tax=Candidatus Kinetoplastidibacterium desouzai TCC079E TaxID=1208919 RepID=M1M539_9PROT|nr:50S ribosomal protein L29 [Candidatus Kinetoplastibacterium desouzaii]AGF47275.1 large subunit ribosomal protein L29 [Candidatus Kinetoplastibacterium desouzaii TCC079E]